MAFKTFVDSVALPASDLNTYLMKQSVIVCTSGTRPSSPPEGMTIYETDADGIRVWDGAAWRAIGWGHIASATGPSVQSDYQTAGNAVSITATLVSGRKYRLSAYVAGTQVTNSGVPIIKFLDNVTEIGRVPPLGNQLTVAASSPAYGYGAVLVSGSGSKTYNLSVGSSTSAFRIAANDAQLILEDLGA